MAELAYKHQQQNKKPLTVAWKSGVLSASQTLETSSSIAFWNESRKKFGDSIEFVKEQNSETFYNIREKNVLDAPSLFPARDSLFLRIEQKIQKIDESAGFRENGQFLVAENVNDNILEKNALYKATITIKIVNTGGKKYKNFVLKIYTLPNASIFIPMKNGEQIFGKTFDFPFRFVTQKDEYLLIEGDGGQGDKEFEYSYYFRPNGSGSYLFPGSFVYFSDDKSFFANTDHQYFHVQ